MSIQPISPGAKPHVIIVGAGIGGLTLALLLERAGVSYVVLEKTSSIKSLGSALSVSGQATYLFRQLGIYEELKEKSLVFEEIRAHDGDCKPTYNLDLRPGVPMAGTDWHIVARPVLYNIIYDKIPKEKIHLGKRVLTILNGDVGARVDCTDGSTFDGDIIVGADGAYSPVRQGLFKWLKKNNRLPSSDDVPMPYNCVCLVGQTGEVDPEEFPEIGKPISVFDNMASTTSSYTWAVFTTKQRTICWAVVEHLDGSSSKEHDSFRNSDWGPEAAGAMAQAVRDFPIPNGGKSGMTLGHLIDKTDKDLISKVVLEEKVYKTWYGGRTVLLGDACHKLNPAGGAGALSAIHDALCLANWLNVLPSLSVDDLEKSFKEYYDERYPIVMAAYRSSKMFAKAHEKNTTGAIVRYMNSHMPKWLWMIALKKTNAYRPQASFLEPAKDTGTLRPSSQPSLIKTRILMEALLKKQGQQKQGQQKTSSVLTTDVDPVSV
ncbi:hypothetical protein EMPS_07407 [Entomortierella parvispora]|uniref:FAD-binding domain-containing protein n=1 Tax=Entomortierella parvispora TaxID=205924 RepID=A0A9P3HE54_9FUNG|nr:hypothetical protein EMPS_07407 [Entomortierella parvispora]